ncbi:unnamed protein product, partial [marine sediment metagenome]
IADFIKESVAVVTNPAIDRDRETEHFSTRVVVGKRPSIVSHEEHPYTVELLSPILIEGKLGNECAETLQQPSYDQLVHAFEEKQLAYFISATFVEHETIPMALNRLGKEACEAVANGKTLLIIDDVKAHQSGHLWIDPLLVISAIDQALTKAGIRRHCSLLLRSGAIRSLHDLIVAYGLGANVISPYLMFATVADTSTRPAIHLYQALNKGLEKVISTIGIHELRGYSRLFSSIGLHDEIAAVLNIVNFFGSHTLIQNFDTLKQDAIARA